MTDNELRRYLKGGLFISSMMGKTNGKYVAERGKGTNMVQIGALIADSVDRSHEAKYLLPLDEQDMVSPLKREVDDIRRTFPVVPIGLNAAPGDLESALRMARAFQGAGGDIFELNCHGGYSKLLKRGLLSAMVLPENRAKMHEWLVRLCRLSIPVVVKFNGTKKDVDFPNLLDGLADIENLFGVHFNIRDNDNQSPNLSLVKIIRPHIRGMLFCSGHVRNRTQVNELFAAGVDCVGISQGLIDDPAIFTHLGSPDQ